MKTCFGCFCLITSHSPSLGILVMVEQPPFPGSVPPGSPFYQPYFLSRGRENDLSSSFLWFFAQPLPIFIKLGHTRTYNSDFLTALVIYLVSGLNNDYMIL